MIHIVSFWIVRYVALNFSATCHFLFLIVVNMRQRQIQINARLHDRDITIDLNSRLYCLYKTKYFKYSVGMTFFCHHFTNILLDFRKLRERTLLIDGHISYNDFLPCHPLYLEAIEMPFAQFLRVYLFL